MDQTDIMEYFKKCRQTAKAAIESTTFPKPILVKGKVKYWGKPQVDRWLAGAHIQEESSIDTEELAEEILSKGIAIKNATTN